MFIRENRTYSKKTESEYVKYQLVESYRSSNGPRQRVITTFLDFDLPKSMWKAVPPANLRLCSGENNRWRSMAQGNPKKDSNHGPS